MAEVRHRRGAVVVALLTATLGAGCATPIRNEAAPRCTKTDALVLMAQSVPSAQLVPCIGPIPAGLTFGDMDIGTGDSTFSLDSSDAGISAVTVRLAATCNTDRATEVASDEAKVGTRQFQRVQSLLRPFRAIRAYRFDGGCVTYRFRFPEQNPRLVTEVSLALEFRTRDHIAEEVRRSSGGRLRL